MSGSALSRSAELRCRKMVRAGIPDSLDGKWKEGHCFPPANLGVPKYKYLVDATLDRSIRFDAEGWAGLDGIICRLDSAEKATCIAQRPGR